MNFFKITPKDCATMSSKVTAAEAAHGVYLNEKGEYQAATQKKYDSLEALDLWMDDFWDVASVAFMDSPQVLESLGVVIPS